MIALDPSILDRVTGGAGYLDIPRSVKLVDYAWRGRSGLVKGALWGAVGWLGYRGVRAINARLDPKCPTPNAE